MDVTLENPGKTGTEGARKLKLLNLSGKRTEWDDSRLTVCAHFSPEHDAFGVFYCKEMKKR